MPKMVYNSDNTDNIADSRKKGIEMTTAEAAQVLRVHSRTMARYLSKEMIPSRALNLRDRVVSIDDLRRFAADHKLTIDEELVKKILTQ